MTNNSIPISGVGSLTTLLKRLEAATSRLEDIAMSQPTNNNNNSNNNNNNLIPYGLPETYISESTAALNYQQSKSSSSLNNNISPPTTAKQSTINNNNNNSNSIELPKSVKGFQILIENNLTKYLNLSSELGGLISIQSKEVEKAFIAQKAFILLASACVKPAATSPGNAALLHPTESAVMAAVDIREKNRSSKEEANQLSTVAEGLPALGWVTMDSKPGPFVGDFKESAQFYANRVVKDNKESNPKQVEWARSFISLLEELRKYIMEFHTTTLTWNAQGIDSSLYTLSTPLSTSPSSSSSTPSPPPPPPPPPAPPAPTASSSSSSSVVGSGGDMGGVFAALNKGESVTSGLKKVDASEMTHKNPELRSAGVVPAVGSGAAKGGPIKPPKPQSFTTTKKLAKTELEGNKWNIENHENNPMILIDQTEINQIINIFNVKNSVIQIKGKVNAVSLVNCTKTSVLLDSTVSSLSISTSPSFTIQILGKVPTILIDGTDGGQVYLSTQSMEVEIISAKSSSINISLPVEGEEEGIFEERAVPEQFKTVVRNGKLITSVVEHSG